MLEELCGDMWDCAVKLVDGLAGESPASADYPVGTVVISGDGAGDQTVESPEVKALDGWIYSGQLRQESKPSSRSQRKRTVVKPRKLIPSPESECEDEGNAETFNPALKASVFGEVLGKCNRRVPRGLRGRHVAKEHQ